MRGPYRCHVCNRPCDNSIKYTAVNTKDIYMGRIDKAKGTAAYFCSNQCHHASYVKATIHECKQNLKEFPMLFYAIECGLRATIYTIPEEFKKFLLCRTMMRDIERFYQATVDGKSEYELHELRLKALHTDGLMLEEVHTYEDSMNYVLRLRTEIEQLNLSLLGNHTI